MRRGKNMSLKQDLEMEYRIVIRIMQKNDFSEGVRACKWFINGLNTHDTIFKLIFNLYI